MTDREKYSIYCKMFDAIPQKRQQLKERLLSSGCTILSDIYVSVGNEENELYFVDVEYKLSNGEYRHAYKLVKL